jgi:hypothetical protein
VPATSGILCGDRRYGGRTTALSQASRGSWARRSHDKAVSQMRTRGSWGRRDVFGVEVCKAVNCAPTPRPSRSSSAGAKLVGERVQGDSRRGTHPASANHNDILHMNGHIEADHVIGVMGPRDLIEGSHRGTAVHATCRCGSLV